MKTSQLTDRRAVRYLAASRWLDRRGGEERAERFRRMARLVETVRYPHRAGGACRVA